MKTELEEAAENFFGKHFNGMHYADIDDKHIIKYGIELAKWQMEQDRNNFSEEDMQKQMYREEEVENIIYELFEDYASNYTNKALEEFEKFKKK